MRPSADERALLRARRARVLEAMGEGVMLLPAATRAASLRRHALSLPPGQRLRLRDRLPRAGRGRGAGAGRREAVRALRPPARSRAGHLGRAARRAWRAPSPTTSADVAHPLDELEKELPAWLGKASQVFLPLGARRCAHATALVAWSAARTRPAPPHRLGRRACYATRGDVLHELRLVKEPAEIVRLRETIAIAAEAHREAMRSVRPGMHEYEIEALIDCIFRRRGASGPAYPSIVAGGANATILHYTANDRPLGARRAAADRRRLRARGLLRRRHPHLPDRAPLQRRRSATSTRRCWPRSSRPSPPPGRAPRWTPSTSIAVRVLAEALVATRPARRLGRRGGREGDATSASTCTAPATGSAATCTTSASYQVGDTPRAARAGHGVHRRARPLRPGRRRRRRRRRSAASASASRTTCWSPPAASRCCPPPCRSRSRRSKPCVPRAHA